MLKHFPTKLILLPLAVVLAAIIPATVASANPYHNQPSSGVSYNSGQHSDQAWSGDHHGDHSDDHDGQAQSDDHHGDHNGDHDGYGGSKPPCNNKPVVNAPASTPTPTTPVIAQQPTPGPSTGVPASGSTPEFIPAPTNTAKVAVPVKHVEIPIAETL